MLAVAACRGVRRRIVALLRLQKLLGEVDLEKVAGLRQQEKVARGSSLWRPLTKINMFQG